MTVMSESSTRPTRPASTMLRRTAILCAVASMFGVVWLFGMFGFGRITEDMCFDDLAPGSGYGGYTMSVQSWPPSIVCRLRGRDLPDRVVQHYGRGAVWAAWTAAAPPIMFGGVILLGIALRRYPPLPTAGPTGSRGDRSDSET